MTFTPEMRAKVLRVTHLYRSNGRDEADALDVLLSEYNRLSAATPVSTSSSEQEVQSSSLPGASAAGSAADPIRAALVAEINTLLAALWPQGARVTLYSARDQIAADGERIEKLRASLLSTESMANSIIRSMANSIIRQNEARIAELEEHLAEAIAVADHGGQLSDECRAALGEKS